MSASDASPARDHAEGREPARLGESERAPRPFEAEPYRARATEEPRREPPARAGEPSTPATRVGGEEPRASAWADGRAAYDLRELPTRASEPSTPARGGEDPRTIAWVDARAADAAAADRRSHAYDMRNPGGLGWRGAAAGAPRAPSPPTVSGATPMSGAPPRDAAFSSYYAAAAGRGAGPPQTPTPGHPPPFDGFDGLASGHAMPPAPPSAGSSAAARTPVSDSLEHEFRVVDERVEHYVSRFLLRSHQGPEAERQLTQIVQAEIRDLLRRTLDAESEVARYKELLGNAHRKLVDVRQESDLQTQQGVTEIEERLRAEQRHALEAREAEDAQALARAQAEFDRQLKSARDEMEARVGAKDSAISRMRETHDSEISKARAELQAERKAHLELMRTMQAAAEERQKERSGEQQLQRERLARDASVASAQRQRVQEQVAQLVASWEAEQRQREAAIQQRFLTQLQAESAEMLKQKEVEVLRVREQLESKFREDLALQLERIGHEHANALATQAETLGAQHAAALSDEQARSRREKGEEHARLREQFEKERGIFATELGSSRRAVDAQASAETERRRELDALREEVARRETSERESTLELQMVRQQLIAREDEICAVKHQMSTTRAECQMRLHMAWVEGFAGKMPAEYAHTLHQLQSGKADDRMREYGFEPPRGSAVGALEGRTLSPEHGDARTPKRHPRATPDRRPPTAFPHLGDAGRQKPSLVASDEAPVPAPRHHKRATQSKPLFPYADSGGDGNESSSSNLLVERPDTRPFGTQLYWRRHDESVDTTAQALRVALQRNESPQRISLQYDPDHPDHPVHVPIKLASGDDEEDRDGGSDSDGGAQVAAPSWVRPSPAAALDGE